MGGEVLDSLGLPCTVLGAAAAEPTAADTRQAAAVLKDAGADLLVFAGGDGTARDLLEVVGQSLPVLGIPSGVKMHSGVFATTPERAGALIDALVEGGLVSLVAREVRDLDEAAIREGEIRPRYFGELMVPEPGGYLQHTKERGVESEPLAVNEIVAEVMERLADENGPVVLGPGSTLGEIKRALGFEGSLLGFDVWQAGEVLARDVSAAWLDAEVDSGRLILSFSRGQGFLIGRGNQQLAPGFLRRLGRHSLWVVGTRTKLSSLQGRPLLMDTDDPELDQEWAGLIEVITGFEDSLLYRLSDHE
jgi:predicted polyphosphate/ATP-dependent NAD kinase